MPISLYLSMVISIHALREEGDSNTSYQRAMADIFLSTPSARRATISGCTTYAPWKTFLSTPSARRATVPNRLLWEHWKISIHALREEGDN